MAPTSKARATRYLFLTLCAWLAGGCSTVELVYDNAAWFIRQRADSYFSLDDAQEQRLREQLLAFERWHRREELPRYARSLDGLITAAADGLARDELEAFLAEVEQARRRLLPRLLPVMAQFLASLSAAQIEAYDARVREDLAEDRETLELTPEEQREERLERLRDTLQDWFGELDTAQRARLRELNDAFPNTYAAWLAQRERRHGEFLALLRSRPHPAAIEAQLYDWWWDLAGGYPPRYREQRLQFRETAKSLVLEVDSLLRPDQRQRASARLARYREDFLRLSQAPPTRNTRRGRLDFR